MFNVGSHGSHIFAPSTSVVDKMAPVVDKDGPPVGLANMMHPLYFLTLPPPPKHYKGGRGPFSLGLKQY